MYTQRIITSRAGIEQRENKYLGKRYTVYYRWDLKPNEVLKEGENEFQNMLDRYFSEEENPSYEKVIGFIVAENGSMSPFFFDDVVYIVNQDGGTFERVYGMLEKNK